MGQDCTKKRTFWILFSAEKGKGGMMAAAIGESLAVQRVCGKCGREETVDRKLQNCSRCIWQGYCNRDCQRAHWSEHKKVCVAKDAELIDSNFQVVSRSIQVSGIDLGLAKALNFCESSIKGAVNSGDKYAQLLELLVCSKSEVQATQFLNEWDDEKVRLAVQGYFLAKSGIDWKNFMFLDLLRISALQGRFALIEYIFRIIKERQIPYSQECEKNGFGWNLVHFVALHAKGRNFPELHVPEIHEMMDAKNEVGASPQDFVLWLSEPPLQSVAAFGEDKPLLDGPEFEKLLGRSYWPRPKITPGALLRTYFESSGLDRPEYLAPLIDETVDLFIESALNGSSPLNMKIRKMEGLHVPASMQGQWECLTQR